jgi:metallophosphoesterase (TIGR03767 family)
LNNQIHKRLIRGQANEKGWRPVVEIEGEILAPAVGRSIAHLIHISDIHICDAQSPARVEALDRFADPHNPLSKLIPLVGTYRAQEILTAQTFEALIRKINAISHGVMCDRLVDAVVITGDVTDNAQQNELKWYLDILHGKLVIPDSGDLTKWEGASTTNAHRYDPSYWNPEGTPPGCEDDFPRARYGFPEIKGLTEAIRAPFIAQGLQHRWFSTHGNHDALLQGTVPPNEELRSFATGDQRLRGLKPETDLVTLFSTFNEVGPANYPNPETVITEKVTPDLQRGFNSRTQWNEIHTTCGHDHGYRAGQTEKYWARDIENLRMISLDTVNHNGGWQGSLSREQFEWLERELQNPDPHYFVILSHHPAGDLFNLYDPNNEGRVGEKEVVELLLAEPRVILWLAGHRHQHKIDLYTANDSTGFWHIETASNIDWPQQGRAIEILETESEVLIVTHVFDHLGERDPDLNVTEFDWRNLAGISRLLAANDWQRRSGDFFIEKNEGNRSDRNVILRRAK